MKKYVFIGLIFFTGLILADDEHVPEPWDLQRENLPGAALEVQQQPTTLPIKLEIQKTHKELNAALKISNNLEQKKNAIEATLQNPSMNDKVKTLQADSDALGTQLKEAKKRVVILEQKLNALQHKAETLQSPLPDIK